MSEYSEYPVFGVTEITRGDDPTPVQLQVRTPDFTTTVVLTGMETRIGHTSYEGYEGNILTCPDETKGSGAIVSIDTLQVKRR